MTTDSLKSLFTEIAKTQSKQELQNNLVNQIGEYFYAKRCQVFLWDSIIEEEKQPKLMKLALSVEYNPILRYLVEYHAPVHEQILLSTEKWRMICPRLDHGHVMVGPIVNHGNLIGALGVTRERNGLPFNRQDIAHMSALSLHLSTWFLKMESKVQSKQLNDSVTKLITPREKQIAQLVAQGLTNAQISESIWITENSVKQALKRMFRKLDVSSRTQMVAKLKGIV